MITNYLALAFIIYIIIRSIMIKGIFQLNESVLSRQFGKLIIFSIFAIAANGITDAIRFGNDLINFRDWLYQLWLLLRYYIQLPLVMIAGYHLFQYIYKNELNSLWNIKPHHLFLMISGLLGYGLWHFFHYIGLIFMRVI